MSPTILHLLCNRNSIVIQQEIPQRPQTQLAIPHNTKCTRDRWLYARSRRLLLNIETLALNNTEILRYTAWPARLCSFMLRHTNHQSKQIKSQSQRGFNFDLIFIGTTELTSTSLTSCLYFKRINKQSNLCVYIALIDIFTTHRLIYKVRVLLYIHLILTKKARVKFNLNSEWIIIFYHLYQ